MINVYVCDVSAWRRPWWRPYCAGDLATMCYFAVSMLPRYLCCRTKPYRTPSHQNVFLNNLYTRIYLGFARQY